MMHGRGKSSPVIVAGKPANKADPYGICCGVGGAKDRDQGECEPACTYRTQCRARVALSG